MRVEFHNYDEDETSVCVMQDTMSKSTTHISIENDDGAESICIYMSDDEVQGFIDKLQRSLDKRTGKKRAKTFPTTPIEWDYIVVFYNRFAGETQTFRVTATNEFRAGREFYRRFDRKVYHPCIESIIEV